MERKMNMRMILTTSAALALLLAPATSFAQQGPGGHAGFAASPRGIANAVAGGGMRSGGGGMHIGGGGGGMHVGGGGWNRGGGVAVGNAGGWNRGGGGGGWHHGGGRGWGGGGGFFPGAVAGAVIGGAIAANSNAYYGPQYGYYDQPSYYYDQEPVVAVAPDDGDSVGYCIQRFKSYDPQSGTYLGYDGLRHPCP
jgi:hypothetical protein